MTHDAMAFPPQSDFLAWGYCVATRSSARSVVAVLRTHRGVGRAARHGDAIERHALNAAAEELRPLRRQRPGVHAHPGDLRRQAAVFDLGAAVHHHLETGVLGELGGLVAADAKLRSEEHTSELQSLRHLVCRL